jgi:hypothetical protein
LTPGVPESFTTMPLHYGHAFGGVREYARRGQSVSEALLSNPVGIGWGGQHTWHKQIDQPVPNLEYPKAPIHRPDGKYQPAALSAVGGHWQPRNQYVGTYDETWRHELAPFLPEDFDERFYQCAPQDQQIDYPQGGEEVRLNHLLAHYPVLSFRLPALSGMKVRILRQDYSTETLEAHADTLYFETEQKRFSVIWRASTPIRRRFHEFDTIAVGAVDPRWWAARSRGIDSGGCVGCASREVA